MVAAQTPTAAALEGFAGELLRPGDEGYDRARQVYNGLIDRRPGLIARCRGVADVVAALAYALEAGGELAVRGGGHSVAGTSLSDGGVTIDLSAMRGIHVDPVRRTVRAQGGVTWAELNRETQLHGLAVTGGVISTTGIAGLTLGGGFGWLASKHGLAVDNLLSVELVTAGGDVVTASADEHEDLFWALRGGGGNLGVATTLEYQLHPVGPTITGGVVVHAFGDAAPLLRFFRGLVASAPDELMAMGGVMHAPDGSGTKVAAVVVGHVGDAASAERDLAPLLAFGSPLDVQVGPLPYCAFNSMLDAGFPTGSLNYWKSTFLRELPDEALHRIIEDFAAAPSPMTSTVLEHYGGAVTRVPVDATAVPHREAGFNLLLASVWRDPAETDANVDWTRRAYDAMEPFAASRRYVNYLDRDEVGDAVARAAYGSNYDRLVDVKRRYDPDNRFRLNTNVRP